MTEDYASFEPEDRDSQDKELWGMAQASGMSRRNFLALMALGGAGTVLAACGGYGDTSATRLSTTASPEGSLIPPAQVPLPPVGARSVTTACD